MTPKSVAEIQRLRRRRDAATADQAEEVTAA
jgi:hypothetical protein